MWICFVGEHFTNYLCIGHLFLPIYRDVNIVYKSEFIRPPDALVVWAIDSFAYALAQSAKLVGIQFIFLFLIPGMFPQLSVLEGLSCFFIEYGNFPVEKKLARVTAS